MRAPLIPILTTLAAVSSAVVLTAGCGTSGAGSSSEFPTPEEAAAPIDLGPQFPSESVPLGGLDTTCATSRAEAKVFPSYVAFLFDRSASMRNAGKWPAVTTALKSFFQDARTAGLHASLTLFPAVSGDMCTADYASPVVGYRTLPDGDPGDPSSLAAALDRTSPGGKTPTVPALKGVYTFAEATRALTPPDAKVAVVLVTDGNPDGCDGNSIGEAGTEAQSRAANVRTFVIGIGTSLSSLHYIARRGGTGEAILVSDAEGETASQLVSALDRITRSAVSCEYAVPEAAEGASLDPSKVNVVATTGDGRELVLPYDPSCAKGGWRYDDRNVPKKIQLCAASCNALVSDRRARVDVLYGCETAVEIK